MDDPTSAQGNASDDPVAVAEAINIFRTPPRTISPELRPSRAAFRRQMTALVDQIWAAPFPFREAVAAHLNDRGADALEAFALWLSALAVRTGERKHLERALFAVGLAIEATGDRRDTILVVPVPGHSARLMGIDPVALYDEVAVELPVAGAELLLRLAPKGDTRRLSPQPGRKVGGGGYFEWMDEEGFRYVERLPPQPGGTQPKGGASTDQSISAKPGDDD